MASRKYNDLTDKKLINIIKATDKITQASVIVTVLTAILCVVKIIFTLCNVATDGELGYSFHFAYSDYMIFYLHVGEIVTSLALIAVEIFVCKIVSYLNSLADILLKNIALNDIEKETESNRSAQWKCPNCGKTNEGYVGTCGCGIVKPN